jgi:DNA-binding SARP family transcriptional activator/predicted ATPase
MKEDMVMSHLALYLLGPPRIERDGVPIQVDTRKAIALLAYIAVTEESHRRASLINLLWPEYDHTRGRAALRRTLYALRKALAGDWLEVDREEIGLAPGAGIWVDVDKFRRHLAACKAHGHPASQVCPACVAPLTDAVALYHGDFLSGFGLKDSINFDDWQFFQADALRCELANALQRLVLWHSGQREFEWAIGYAKRWLALDPLDEQASCHLMQLYAWSGQRPAALRQYEQYVQVLQDQLGVPPSEEIAALYKAIEQGHAPALPTDQLCKSPEEPAHRLDIPAQPPAFLEGEDQVQRPVFVAREAELAQLAGFLDSALAGKSKVVFVSGDAGCGKTALIQEFARRAQAANPDLVVAWGHGNAHTGSGDPYLPFREVLGLLTGDVEAQWAAGAMTGEQARRLWRLLPGTVQALVEVGPDLIDLFVPGTPLVRRTRTFRQRPGAAWPTQLEELVARKSAIPSSPNLQQSALFEQYSQVLRALARQGPLLLALDDLQWVDGGSANLLFHLGRRIGGSRILIVGAYRPAEIALGRPAGSVLIAPAPGQAGEGIEGERERHPLEPIVNEFKRTFGDIEVDLHRAEGRQFVDAFLDSEPNQLGDAFRETLHQHTAGYPLFTLELLRGMQERGDLVRDEEGRWVEGPELEWQMLPARVEAVIAERIGRLPERLRHILTVASVEGETFTAEVIAKVDAADEAETVRCLSDTLDRKHRLVGAQRFLRLDGQRLSRYRFRHILFQKHLYHSLDPVQRVYLHQAVGAVLETLYGESAEQTEAIAPELARHFMEAGITHKAVEYLHQAAERAQRLYANTEAIETFRRALVLLESAPPDKSRTNWRQQMAARIQESLGDVLEWTGEHDQAKAAYEEALAHLPVGELIWQAHLYRKIGNIWRLQSEYETALQAYDLAQATLGQGSAESTAEWWQEWVQIQLERMWMYYWLGQWREMSELARIRSLVEQYGTPTQGVNFFLALGGMNNRRDRYVVSEETLELCQIALAMSQEGENLGDIAWARFVLGFGQLWYGDLDAAEQQMQAALALAEQTGDIVHQSRCLTYLTVLYRKRGPLDKVRHYVSRSFAAAAAGQMIEYTGMARANLAWLAWHEGDLAEAETEGQAALELWQQLPAGHSSCAFQWTALWPLVGVAFARNRMSEASKFARALLEPTQQRLPDDLTVIVQKAVRAWEGDESEAAHSYLAQALELAQSLGYL